jgi:hypothetical protein
MRRPCRPAHDLGVRWEKATMKRRIMAMTVATAATALLSLIGCKADPRSSLTATPPQTTTIPLSFAWDVEPDAIVHPNVGTTDFFWFSASETDKRLITQEGVKAAIVESQSFDEITAKYILRKSLKPIGIVQAVKERELEPGTVVIFETVEGNLGKLVVEKYRSLHDLGFPEAANFTDQWKAVAEERDDIPECHIQIKWSLFQ